MITADPRQDIELRIQQIEQKIQPKYLTPLPPYPDDWIRKGQLILQAIRWVADETETMQNTGDRAFIRSRRYGFEFILITGCIWFLLGKIASVPAIPALVVSVFLGLFMFWFLLSEERKYWDRIHSRERQALRINENKMHRLMAEKQLLEEQSSIQELNQDVLDRWLEENHLWQMHANERAALAELREKLAELMREEE